MQGRLHTLMWLGFTFIALPVLCFLALAIIAVPIALMTAYPLQGGLLLFIGWATINWRKGHGHR
jgi:hypothetical protein